VALVVAWAGCVATDAVQCADGTLCPGGTTCVALTGGMLCATADQISACRGKADLEQCTLAGDDMAYCSGGACLESLCGNGRIDPGEVCDDRNVSAGDQCSADCKSDETCGNGIVDQIHGETCDDGNHLDHDGCSSSCRIETLAWVRHTMRPTARRQGAAAWDAARDRVVVFGGQSDSGVLPECWEWNGRDWARYAGIVPPARVQTAMAFDGNGVVLYGGNGAADTWTFDGSTWTPAFVTGPGERHEHAMAYDAHRKRVVLFGGASTDDTWEWDGASWKAVGTVHAPTPRAAAMMAYDPVRGVIVLAGGRDYTSGVVKTDTWTYDGSDWHDTLVTAPALQDASLAWDTGSQHLIAFGGCGNACSSSSNETWAWTGTAWLDLGNTNAPPARVDAQLAGTSSGLVLFGGLESGTTANDTWLYRSSTWAPAPWPGARSGFSLARDAAHGNVVLVGGSDGTGAALQDTWTASRLGWRKVATTLPANGNGMALAYDPIARDLLGVGALTGTASSPTFTWNGSIWSVKTPPQDVPERFGEAFAFDGHTMTVFGGVHPGMFQMNTWSWNETTWTQSTSSMQPMDSGPGSIQATYDAVHGKMVAFGDGTWTYDGTTWTKLSPATTPPRTGRLVWDAPRKRAVMISSNALEVWEWDGTDWARYTTDTAPQLPAYDVTESFDGTGVFLYGAELDNSFHPTNEDAWELRWSAGAAEERCDGADRDGDHLDRCADPDCWSVCTPFCEPGAACDMTAPRCGDGTCDADHEDCHTCSQDCTCTPVCGDGYCDPGETCAGDCP